jgi:hypothetical protein
MTLQYHEENIKFLLFSKLNKVQFAIQIVEFTITCKVENNDDK